MSMDWFNVTEWGSPMDWGVALGLATLTFLVLGMLRRGVRAHYRKMLATDHTEWLELPFGVLARTPRRSMPSTRKVSVVRESTPNGSSSHSVWSACSSG